MSVKTLETPGARKRAELKERAELKASVARVQEKIDAARLAPPISQDELEQSVAIIKAKLDAARLAPPISQDEIDRINNHVLEAHEKVAELIEHGLVLQQSESERSDLDA